MKLERIPEYLTTFTVTLLGIGFALYCGRLTGQGQTSMIALILFGIMVAVLCLTMKTRIWVFIPFGWVLYGKVAVLPLPFAVRDLIVMFVTALFLIFIALKMVRRKIPFGLLELLLTVNLLYLISVFIRNPVGTEAMQSARVGGKPYFDVAMGFLAFLVLSRASMTEGLARILPLISFAGYSVNAVIGTITHFIPSTVPILSQFYSGVSYETYSAQDYRSTGETSGRIIQFQQFGHPLTQYLIAYFPPITLISPLYIFRTTLFAIGCIALMFSGFRTSLVAMGFAFAFSSYIRRGFTDILRGIAVGIPILALLILMQGTLINLPRPVQRALSFLPGKWDYEAVIDAEGSTNWRVQMWKIMLTEDGYIGNKLLGDGFGFNRILLEGIRREQAARMDVNNQEATMHLGTVHSGPVSAIKYVGIVGLLLYCALIITMAHRAYRLIRRAQGTRFFEPVLFFSIPIVYDPILFIFIFGGFDASLPNTLFYLGMLQLLTNTLDDHERAKSVNGDFPRNQPYLPRHSKQQQSASAGRGFGRLQIHPASKPERI